MKLLIKCLFGKHAIFCTLNIYATHILAWPRRKKGNMFSQLNHAVYDFLIFDAASFAWEILGGFEREKFR